MMFWPTLLHLTACEVHFIHVSGPCDSMFWKFETIAHSPACWLSINECKQLGLMRGAAPLLQYKPQDRGAYFTCNMKLHI